MDSGSSGAEWVAGELVGSAARVAPAERRSWGRWAVLALGGLSYGLFVTSLARFIGFVSGLGVRDVDSGPWFAFWPAVTVDVPLVLALALPYGLISLPRSRPWWTRRIPAVARRSAAVGVVSLLLLLLVDQWRSVPALVWYVADPLGRAAIWGAAAFGWTLVVGATFMLDHFETLGLRQCWRHFRGSAQGEAGLQGRMAYRFVRPPLLAGLLIGLWAAPTLTEGRALLAGLFTSFLAAGLLLEAWTRRGARWRSGRMPVLRAGPAPEQRP
jgi:hypothetical protein